MRSADARVSIAILIAIRLVDKWTMPRRIHGTHSSTGNALPAGSSIWPMHHVRSRIAPRSLRFRFGSLLFSENRTQRARKLRKRRIDGNRGPLIVVFHWTEGKLTAGPLVRICGAIRYDPIFNLGFGLRTCRSRVADEFNSNLRGTFPSRCVTAASGVN